MSFSLGAFALVEVTGPASGGECGVEGELNQGLAEGLVGGVSAADAAMFAALNGQRRNPPGGGELAVAGSMFAIFAEAGQQRGDRVRALDRQGLEDLSVGVIIELLLNLFIEIGDGLGQQFDLGQQVLDVRAQAGHHGLGDRHGRGLTCGLDASSGLGAEPMLTNEGVNRTAIHLMQVLLKWATLQQSALPDAMEVVSEAREVGAPIIQAAAQAMEQGRAFMDAIGAQLDERSQFERGVAVGSDGTKTAAVGAEHVGED